MIRSGLATLLVTWCAVAQEGAMPVVAEASDWRATGRHAEVLEFVQRLAKASPVAHLTEMGTSHEGRAMPLLILANPPVAGPEQARASGRMVVYAQGGIHSGECCGKEALQMIARELAADPDHPLLKDLIILIAPIYNPDGNERVSKNNRPGQAGPEEGMGQRATAQGYDLNRDNTKLDSPEAQALSRVMNTWDPLLVVDTHTTNGSYHRNTLTFDGPVNPAGDRRIIYYVRDVMLPSVSERVESVAGYKTTFYGNSNRDKTRWTTYDGRPRFGTRARGIRGILSVITEAYKYAPYKDRVLCTKAFVEETFRHAAANRALIEELVGEVRGDAVKRGANPRPDDLVALRVEVARIPKDIAIHGWVEKVPEGATGRRARPRPTNEEKTYTMEHWGAYAATHSVRRPHAYLYPKKLVGLTEKLRQHGVLVEEAPAGVRAATEVYTISRLKRARRAFQKHVMLTLEAEGEAGEMTIPADTMLVRTAHPLGNLIVYLLEPESEDGLAAWNVLDDHVAEGATFPVIRVLKPLP